MSGSAVIAFLSSTSRDLCDHRAFVRKHCLSFGYEFQLMEEFGAQDHSAVPVSLGELNGCQVFVGVYARRYGYTPPGSIKSITEMEYDEAERRGIPRLLFVVAPEYSDHPLLEQHRDDSQALQAKCLSLFLERISRQRVWDTFTTPEHLANRVAFAISKWEGWRPPQSRKFNSRYVGRDVLLQQIDLALSDNSRIALVGMAGIGKTHTAMQVAIQVASKFSSGIFWVGLGVEAKDPERVVQITMRAWSSCHHPGRLAEASNLTPESVREWLMAAPGPILVVLDDVWHARVGRELLSLVPDSANVLVTTRRLDIARQLNVDPIIVDQFSTEEAIALLRDRVGELPSLTSLRRIADQLAGHPLTLEIIAAQIATGPPDLAESLPDLIAAKLSDVTGSALSEFEAQIDMPPNSGVASGQYASLEAALTLSYETFPGDLKRRFQLTGTLAPDAPISSKLLAAVWEDSLSSEPEEQEFLSRISALVSASVLVRAGKAFTQHALVRFYALAIARRTGNAQIAESRYIMYVLDSVLPLLELIEPGQWDAELGEEIPHIHFVGDRLVTSFKEHQFDVGIGELVCQFASGVERYLEHRREISGVQWLEAAVSACEMLGDVQGQIRFMVALAGDYYTRRDSRSALKPAYQAWKLAMQHNDEIGQARASLYLGYHYTHSDPFEAPKYFEAAAAKFSTLGDKHGLVESLIYLSICKADSINPPPVRREGIDLLQQALAVARSSGYALGEIRALTRLGILLETCADYTDAKMHLDESVLVARSLGSQVEEALALLSLAAVLVALGELVEAQTTLEMALALFEAVGDRVGQGTALRNAAQVAELMNEPARAAELYISALPFVRKRTMLESDAFIEDDMRAIPSLLVRIDDILFNDTREQFRLNAYKELFAQDVKKIGRQQAESKWGEIGHDCQIPDDIWSFLVRQTLRAANGTMEDSEVWLLILESVVTGLENLGNYWAVDKEFAQALLDVTASRPDSLSDSHTYFGMVCILRNRLERISQDLPVYGVDELRYFLSNTLAVRTTAKDKRREWVAELRRKHLDALNWGDSDSAEFLHALVGVSCDRLASVSSVNPYRTSFAQLLDLLGTHCELLEDYIERNSIAIKLDKPDQLTGWCDSLSETLELALLWQDHREYEYLTALIQLLNDGNGILPGDHYYGPSLNYISTAITSRVMPPNIPLGYVRQMTVIAQNNVFESVVDKKKLVQQNFLNMSRDADAHGDQEESEFARILLAIASAQKVSLETKNPYRVYLEARLGIQFYNT